MQTLPAGRHLQFLHSSLAEQKSSAFGRESSQSHPFFEDRESKIIKKKTTNLSLDTCSFYTFHLHRRSCLHLGGFHHNHSLKVLSHVCIFLIILSTWSQTFALLASLISRTEAVSIWQSLVTITSWVIIGSTKVVEDRKEL